MSKANPKVDKTFEEAAAELGEARPLDDVLRQLVKPKPKRKKGDDPKAAAQVPKKGE